MPQGSMPNFAFFSEEHPYGREMFRQLVSSGFVPKVIISEDRRSETRNVISS